MSTEHEWEIIVLESITMLIGWDSVVTSLEMALQPVMNTEIQTGKFTGSPAESNFILLTDLIVDAVFWDGL
jgi:hypothetical protein